MVNVYMIISKILLRASPVFLLKQIILFISSVHCFLWWMSLVKYFWWITRLWSKCFNNSFMCNAWYTYKWTKCMQIIWKTYDIRNGLIHSPTYGKKIHLTKISCCIGEFHKVHSRPMLKKYAYHRLLLCLIGKHELKTLISEDFWQTIMLWWQNVIILKHWRNILTWKFRQRHFASTSISRYKSVLVSITINITIIHMTLLIMQILHFRLWKVYSLDVWE